MNQNEPTTGELIAALKRCREMISCEECVCFQRKISDRVYLCDHNILTDRLESQERTIAELIESRGRLVTALAELTEKIAELTARAEKAERERDAAIKDIEMVMIDNICYGCISYKNGECSRCDNRCVPKWRGQPQEGEGV